MLRSLSQESLKRDKTPIKASWSAQRSSMNKIQSTQRKKTQRANSELSFKSQEEIDNYNFLRLGYKSPMEGFGEDFFVSLLKS